MKQFEKNDQDKKRKLIIISGLIALVIVVLIIILIFKTNNKKNKLEEEKNSLPFQTTKIENKEKEELIQESARVEDNKIMNRGEASKNLNSTKKEMEEEMGELSVVDEEEVQEIQEETNLNIVGDDQNKEEMLTIGETEDLNENKANGGDVMFEDGNELKLE